MSKKDFETDGTRNERNVFCPIRAMPPCPYCDEYGLCHINDPVEECSDFSACYESWKEYEDDYDDYYNSDDDADETGFNPYEGGYDYDC